MDEGGSSGSTGNRSRNVASVSRRFIVAGSQLISSSMVGSSTSGDSSVGVPRYGQVLEWAWELVLV